MKFLPLLILTCSLLVPALPVGGEPADTPPQTTPHWERYQLLIERNIFSRHREKPARPAEPPAVPSESADPAEQSGEAEDAPPPESSHFVLAGVSIVGGRATALFEDRRDGAIHTVHAGDVLADHTLSAITLDGVTSEAVDRSTTLAPGQTLAGEVPTAATRSDASAPAAASPTTQDEPATRDAGASAILERLRQRRQQELQK